MHQQNHGAIFALFVAFCTAYFFSTSAQGDENDSLWRDRVRECLDTMVEHGTDRYGEKKTPLMMAVIDVNTHESPEHPLLFDSLVRLEERLHRRGERGSNLWYDQALLRSLHRMSNLTGEKKYATAADAYVEYFFKHCYKADDGKEVYRNGMPAWGTHIYWDCYRDQPGGDQGGQGPHEILVYQADWDTMYRINPAAVRKTVEGIWKWHIVDKQTGLHNRHDDARQGFEFAFSGGSFSLASAYMYRATGEEEFLRRAKLIADWHWSHRDKVTGLVADVPARTDRYDGNHCFTTITGPHAAQLLRCYEVTGDEFFRQAPITYIKAYDKYGWDEKAGSYYAMLKLDGTPMPEQGKGQGYDAWAPHGHVNVWRTSIYSYEFSLCAAQSAIYAYELSGKDEEDCDAELLAIARKWAKIIQDAMPPQTGRRWKTELEKAMPEVKNTAGAYAEDYGRAISFFVHLHRATGDPKHLELAQSLADEAVTKLFKNGLFKGHPAKPYYECTNGVGLLLFALLELDAPNENLGGAF